MTRSERLMHLIHILKTQRRVTIEKLGSLCDVSNRTIYRDMATLAKMNVPVYYDNGYRLSRTSSFPMAEFGIEDLELLCYCLRNNPLVDNTFFLRRFRVIERKVLERLRQRTGSNRQAVFLFDTDISKLVRTPESSLLEQFIRAIVEGRKVELVGTIRTFGGMWVPLSIKSRHKATLIVVSRSVIDTPEEIPIAELRDVRIAEVRFDRLQADHLRRSVAGKKKELTPVEL